MSLLAGALGEGKVLVLQPAMPSPSHLEVALGLQRFWQKTLKAAGRPAACAVMIGKVEAVHVEGELEGEPPIAVGDKHVLPVANWDDDGVVAASTRFGCRWALVPTFVATESHVRLDTRFVEVDDGVVRPVGDAFALDTGWSAFPTHVWEVLVEVARRVGATPPYSRAEEAFDTVDVAAAIAILEAMGMLSMAEDHCRLEVRAVFASLTSIVETVGAARPLVAIVPELFDHLGRLGAHDLQLAGFLRSARRSLGTLPTEWGDLLERLAAGRRQDA
jgi:hypothetical protein